MFANTVRMRLRAIIYQCPITISLNNTSKTYLRPADGA